MPLLSPPVTLRPSLSACPSPPEAALLGARDAVASHQCGNGHNTEEKFAGRWSGKLWSRLRVSRRLSVSRGRTQTALFERSWRHSCDSDILPPFPSAVKYQTESFSRARLSAVFFRLDHKISWECAELFVERGSGRLAPTSQPNASCRPLYSSLRTSVTPISAE
ncbi:hypothetical protein BJV77DRAFT_1027994 [Russula vinacea]|nr:hypothetical protein BJV77DRAFT_1027994 [Russula vinacea]